MKVFCFQGDMIYEGYFQFIDSYASNPKIALVAYRIFRDNVILLDASGKSNRTLLLDTAKMDRIVIIYDNESGMCTDIKRFCDYAADNKEQGN